MRLFHEIDAHARAMYVISPYNPGVDHDGPERLGVRQAPAVDASDPTPTCAPSCRHTTRHHYGGERLVRPDSCVEVGRRKESWPFHVRRNAGIEPESIPACQPSDHADSSGRPHATELHISLLASLWHRMHHLSYRTLHVDLAALPRHHRHLAAVWYSWNTGVQLCRAF